ncbi:unnamed protein product [Cylindrotheca closterium]|uniref:Sialate O-acetylesterase domain-containing protein n=1 Tax=Cylindrotheca closterium TaxID=2856 RepID=A0AAD2CR50_9STRA|nr:unnamed protein product [Cylindrotheca closterium]
MNPLYRKSLLFGALTAVVLYNSTASKCFCSAENRKKPSTVELSTNRSYSPLPIETYSTLANDISRIWHEPIENRVCVEMMENATCPHPALWGRLSGPALAILDWTTEKNQNSTANVLCGSYNDSWLDAGDYYVEIVVLYCDDFGVKTMNKKKNITDWFHEDLRPKCVENAQYNRITSIHQSYITVVASTTGAGNSRIGRWVKRPGSRSQPLFTRYQPVGCVEASGTGYKPQNPLPKWCNMFVNRDEIHATTERVGGLPQYDFQWGMNTTDSELTTRIQHVFRNESSRLPFFCAIGDSHSRFVVMRSVKQLEVRGLMTFIRHQWPNASAIGPKMLQKNCGVVIIQIGQWPASISSGGYPFSFARYYNEMKLHVQAVLDAVKDIPHAKVYLPSVDLGPLMGAINLCRDWRTPTVLGAYSFVLQLIASELNNPKLEYIDTRFIIETHWDGGPDWLHLQEEVRLRKTMYILAIAMAEIEDSLFPRLLSGAEPHTSTDEMITEVVDRVAY